MASSDIRRFYFYQKYLWKPADFLNYQTWVDATMAAFAEGLVGSGVLSGLQVTPNALMTVDVAAGIANNASGRVVVAAAASAVAVASPVGNPAWSLIVLRPKTVDMDTIQEPTSPSTPVPLDYQLSYDLVVLNGTASATPAYPATQAGDIIIWGGKLTAGMSVLTMANWDFDIVDRPRKRTRKIRIVTSAEALALTAEIVELDPSGGDFALTLPSAQSAAGLEFDLIHVGASGTVTLTGTVAGQINPVLDTQYQSVKLYSNGTVWRFK